MGCVARLHVSILWCRRGDGKVYDVGCVLEETSTGTAFRGSSAGYSLQNTSNRVDSKQPRAKKVNGLCFRSSDILKRLAGKCNHIHAPAPE